MQGIGNLWLGTAGLLQNLEIKDPGISRQFMVGERLQAMVLAKEGDNYLIQSGARLFQAQSNLHLQVGEKLLLYVAEQKDGKTILKLETERPEGMESPKWSEKSENISRLKLLAEKFGKVSEREISQLVEQLSKLPVDEQTGIRYLLAPHLTAAVLVPPSLENNYQVKLELEQYKEMTGNRQIWELSLWVSFPALGYLEIVLKLIEGKSYVRIWAEQAETEALLRARQEEMNLDQALIEIVPAPNGPLLPHKNEENIDMRV